MILHSYHGRHLRIYDARKAIDPSRFKVDFYRNMHQSPSSVLHLSDDVILDDRRAFDELLRNVADAHVKDFGSFLTLPMSTMMMRRSFDSFDSVDDKLESDETFAVYCVARRNVIGGPDAFERRSTRANFKRVIDPGFVAIFDHREIRHLGFDAIERIDAKFQDAHVDVICLSFRL